MASRQRPVLHHRQRCGIHQVPQPIPLRGIVSVAMPEQATRSVVYTGVLTRKKMHTTYPACRIRGGFTLIETLVVVGIFAVLASVLFPALTRAKRKGRDAQCISNLRQQFLGLQGFVSSHGVYPLSPTILPKGRYPDHDSGWMYSVQNEIATPSNADSEWRWSGIWSCPSRRQLSRAELGGSYGYNSEGLGLSVDEGGLGLGGHYVRRWSGWDNSPVAESEVESPVACLLWGTEYLDRRALTWTGWACYGVIIGRITARTRWSSSGSTSDMVAGSMSPFATAMSGLRDSILFFRMKPTAHCNGGIGTTGRIRSDFRNSLPCRNRAWRIGSRFAESRIVRCAS